MDLDECFKKGLIKITKVDEELIQSLVEMSDIKEKTVKTANIDKVNISAYVSLAYDSLREMLEAFCVLKGYKVLSHVCIGELLKKDFDADEYNEFDRMRWVRNSINYYGIKVEFEQGKDLIKKIFSIRKSIFEKYLRIDKNKT